MNRRSLILGLTGALAAPAVVRAESLMKLWVPPKPKFGLRKWAAKNEDLFSSYEGAVDVGSFDFYTYTWVRVGWDEVTGKITRTIVALEDVYADQPVVGEDWAFKVIERPKDGWVFVR